MQDHWTDGDGVVHLPSRHPALTPTFKALSEGRIGALKNRFRVMLTCGHWVVVDLLVAEECDDKYNGLPCWRCPPEASFPEYTKED